jgi:phage host-nuclease inhibitor protein Gam
MEEGTITGVPLNELTRQYVKLRDHRAEIKAAYESMDAGLKEKMDALETEMLDVCKAINADSIKTDSGTVIRSIKTRYWTNDWDSMHRFIAENHAFGLLEKRLHQTNMKQFLEENPDLEPAGLNVDKEYTVVVRRAK